MFPHIRVLIDYGSEGYKFMNGEFVTVNEAVKAALNYSSCFPFVIVDVINWEAKPTE